MRKIVQVRFAEPKTAPKPKTAPVSLSLRDIETALYGLKIWRQVVVGQTFIELREGQTQVPYTEAIGDVDQAIDRLERGKEKF
jgi:hypothetical protein